MPSTLQLKQREHPNDRRKKEETGSNTMAETGEQKHRTDRICGQIFIGYREVCNEPTRFISCSMGTGTFSFILLRKAN